MNEYVFIDWATAYFASVKRYAQLVALHFSESQSTAHSFLLVLNKICSFLDE